MSKCPLVMIEWVDSRQPGPGWRWLSSFKPSGPCDCASVGWLIHDGDDVKALAPNMADLGYGRHAGVGCDPDPDACHPPDRAARRAELTYFFFGAGFALSGACDSADAATLFCDCVDFGLLRIFDAFEATDFEVRSLFAIALL